LVVSSRRGAANSADIIDHAVIHGVRATQCTVNTVNTVVFAAKATKAVLALFCLTNVSVGAGCRGVRSDGVLLQASRCFNYGAQL
jgi:hypothetical protein